MNTNDFKLTRNNIHHARGLLHSKLFKRPSESHNSSSTAMDITTKIDDNVLFYNYLVDFIFEFSRFKHAGTQLMWFSKFRPNSRSYQFLPTTDPLTCILVVNEQTALETGVQL